MEQLSESASALNRTERATTAGWARRVRAVPADELPSLAERLGRPLYIDGVVGQLTPGLAGIAEQHADAAVDVELGVKQRCTGPRRQRVKLVAVLAQRRGERPEQRGPLVEG